MAIVICPISIFDLQQRPKTRCETPKEKKEHKNINRPQNRLDTISHRALEFLQTAADVLIQACFRLAFSD